MIKYFLFIMVFASINSFAQKDEWTTKKTQGGKVKYKSKTFYDFQGSGIDGKLKSPSGALISPRKKVQVDRLLKLRNDFDPEVDASAAGTR